MAQFTLYSYFRSSTSYRTRIAMHFKGLEFENKPVHLIQDGGQQYAASYKALNPSSEVPTLIHEGHIISQSVAIIEYLDEIAPQPKLYPGHAGQKAKIRQFCEIINCTHPYHNVKTTKYLESELQIISEKKDQWVQYWINKGLEPLEEMAKKYSDEFSFGNQFSAADCFLIPMMFSAHRFGVDTSKFSILSRINERALKLDFVQKSHPYRQPDTPEEMRSLSLV